MTTATRPGVHRHFHRFAWLAVALTLCVVVFGAYVRLSDAGMGCPDWPTCYGRATWPKAAEDAARHAAIDVRPYEIGKAWREQVHRHIAAILGVLVLGLALLAARKRRFGIARILAAAALVAAAIPLYMHGEHVLASVLAILGEAILLYSALRWSNLDLARTATLTLAVIIFQSLLGMWTVTLLLKPIVVMGHLLGGLTTLSLLVWMAWRSTHMPITLVDADRLRRWLIGGLALLGLQIALGGWVSANYAALSCGAGSWSMSNFPQCVGRWWPPADFREGFVLWRGIGVDYEGGVLDGASRIAIQMAHRVMAGLLALYLLALGWRLLRTPGLRGWAATLVAALGLQISLGILNVKLSLPLHVAVAHNAGAVLLLFVLVTLLARLRRPV
ncbi:MAG TPA: COX15/CtaA family protein [Pseudoxanthomonas sp.]|nr:COX15/CtaA family protein [Pseudoxanthomonas sp.]